MFNRQFISLLGRKIGGNENRERRRLVKDKKKNFLNLKTVILFVISLP